MARRAHHRRDANTAANQHDAVGLSTGENEGPVREDNGLVSRWLHDDLKLGDEVEVNGTFVFTVERPTASC